MPKKKHSVTHVNHYALEQLMIMMQETYDDKNFQTPEETEFWLQYKAPSKHRKNFASSPEAKLGEAQALVWSALAESEDKRISMANKALQISADCADAYVVLADLHAEDSREKAENLYRKGIAAGRRVLGDSSVDNLEKDFWKDYTMRPFMRAINGLASLLQDFGEPNQAIELWQELLRLNPNDDQTVHLRLVPALISLDRFGEAQVLFDKYKLESTAALAYSLALMLFKQNGDTKESRDALVEAMSVNENAIYELLILTHRPLVGDMKHSIEEQAEAKKYVMYAYVDWEDTEGAIGWVADLVKKRIEKQAQKLSLVNTFPGLKFIDETHTSLREMF